MSKNLDIKHLLRQAADGIEDAEVLLRRADFARNRITPEWEAACDYLETLADLSDQDALSSAQREQFEALKRRVEKLRPDLARRNLLEPRLDWPVETNAL